MRIWKTRIADAEREDNETQAGASTNNADDTLVVLVRLNDSVALCRAGWEVVQTIDGTGVPFVGGFLRKSSPELVRHSLRHDSTRDSVAEGRPDVVSGEV